MNRITIWQPRWHDEVVLIMASKVREENEVVFTKSPSLGTMPYLIRGEVIKRYPLGTNGKKPCYEVPLDVVLGRTT